MTSLRRLVCLLIVLVSSRELTAQSSDSAAVVSAVQRLFDAMAKRDTVAARALLLPGSEFMSIRPNAQAPRHQADTSFLRSLGAGKERMLERMWAPVVHVHGPMAVLWAPYDFHIDGRFSHCGVDTFTLVRGAAGWRIASILYTVEPTGCAPSPLGPP
jgi:hypothetical protein